MRGCLEKQKTFCIDATLINSIEVSDHVSLQYQMLIFRIFSCHNVPFDKEAFMEYLLELFD